MSFLTYFCFKKSNAKQMVVFHPRFYKKSFFSSVFTAPLPLPFLLWRLFLFKIRHLPLILGYPSFFLFFSAGGPTSISLRLSPPAAALRGRRPCLPPVLRPRPRPPALACQQQVGAAPFSCQVPSQTLYNFRRVRGSALALVSHPIL